MTRIERIDHAINITEELIAELSFPTPEPETSIIGELTADLEQALAELREALRTARRGAEEQ